MQFINNFRGIAILLVIFIHALSTISISDSYTLSFIAKLIDNCTILFVVVAGYLFSFQARNFNYPRFLLSKVHTVVIPYAFISLPAILLYILDVKHNHYWIDMEWFDKQNPLYQYLFMMVTGASLGPLWFIPMIIVLYLFSPFFVALKEKKLLVIAFIISLLPAAYYGRPEFNENILQACVYFLPSYLLGIIISEHGNIYKKISYLSAIALIAFVIIYFFIIDSVELVSNVDLFFKLVLAIIVLSFCYRYLNKKHRLLDMFARLSFFLFFIHGYLASFPRALSSKYDFSNFELVYVLFSFTFIIISSLIIFVFIKLTLKNNSKRLLGI